MLPSGQLDPSPFDPEANFPVYAIAIQADKKIVIGGSFTALIPQTGKTGTPTTTTGPYGTVTILPAPGASATTPIYVNHLARLNTDGTLDTTFYPDPSSDILSIAIQSNSDRRRGHLRRDVPCAVNGATTGVIRNYIGRVSSNGTLDSSFNPNANGLVNSTTVLPNQHILAGGSFTTLQPDGAASPTFVANHVAEGPSTPDGTTSTSAALRGRGQRGPNGQVNAFAIQPNGQFIFGGSVHGKIGGSHAPFANLGRFNGDAN